MAAITTIIVAESFIAYSPFRYMDYGLFNSFSVVYHVSLCRVCIGIELRNTVSVCDFFTWCQRTMYKCVK